MIKFLSTFFLLAMMGSQLAFGQNNTAIYNPDADAKAEVDAAVARAAASGKHVFLQIGGNWCPWCLRFHAMLEADRSLDSLVKVNYEIVRVNYSKENKNEALLASLGYPQRFGFPVFVILNGKGEVIHIQDSGYLEQDKGYSREKVERFFLNWSHFTMEEAKQKYSK